MNSRSKISFSAIVSTDDVHDWNTISDFIQKIEQAGFSAFIVKDPVINRSTAFEPLTLLSAVATLTSRIGLVATVSTNDNEPYHIARRLASLDHISGGRAGWNIHTNTFNGETVSFPEITERAQEFLQITKGLWDSYADDAVVADKNEGVYFLPERRRALHHNGKYFQVAGPLNLSRPPQGYPVIFHTVSSEADIYFAIANADVVLLAAQSVDEVIALQEKINETFFNTDGAKKVPRIWLKTASVLDEVLSDFGSATAEQIANQITEWHQLTDVDGFAFPFNLNTAQADTFINEVLPILTHRDLFETPTGNTLREQTGILRPKRQRI